MGGGSWTTSAYVTHSTTTRGYTTMDAFNSASAQDLYRSVKLHEDLNPYKVTRECCDSEEHPETIPVILALDVTGSMGPAAEAVAKQLNDIMENLYGEVKDIEFMTMAIGDLSYDNAPIQASQFESDIRIAEQLEKIYFERGGGGNMWESYTAAWFFALHNTKLDCWKRGKKGIIITMGDEPMNPFLPKAPLERVLGCTLQADVETPDLYKAVTEKYDVYHIGVDDRNNSFRWNCSRIRDSFGKFLGDHYKEATCQDLHRVISDIIVESSGGNNSSSTDTVHVTEEGISW